MSAPAVANTSAEQPLLQSDAVWWKIALALCIPVFLLTFQGPGLWTKRTFRGHRIGGFVFLTQYAIAWYIFVSDYEAYRTSLLPFTVSGMLIVQVLTAIYTFTFLPKKSDDPGIYSDKGVLPYAFVVEALFFAMMIEFGNCYYDSRTYDMLTGSAFGNAVECLWVFLAFQLIRPRFPKTHMGDAAKARSKTTSDRNVWFYNLGTLAIKMFYVAHKHMIGFFFNYLRFQNVLGPLDMYWLHWMMLVNVGTQSIGTFTHTLRFKGLLPPRVAYGIYVAYAYASYYALTHLGGLYWLHPQVAAVTAGGMLLNFARFNGASKVQGLYQCGVMAWMLSRRYGLA
eukprot:TRINITY_DN12460_c3_g1_i1.p1 TRINITY_DN12460_c3_g1~~TRINITY_DN12460_c3_g1_i1.p1  ORF type:complete len:354 (+),score=79.82 TRINITY_DN12460_c3_g1_i1:46-1062(+)